MIKISLKCWKCMGINIFFHRPPPESVCFVQPWQIYMFGWSLARLYAQVSLCRIYCRTSTNWPFKFVWVIIPGHSSPFLSIRSVLLMHVGSAGEYESFEHVQKFCVASANKFHSCLYALKMCSYRVCHTAYVLYSSHSHCILTVFWLF